MVFYLGLLGVLAAMAWRVKKEKWIVLCLLATALMPMGVRWLTDGMETSLSVLFAALAGSNVAETEAGDRNASGSVCSFQCGHRVAAH